MTESMTDTKLPAKRGPKGPRKPEYVPVPDAPPVDRNSLNDLGVTDLTDIFSGLSITALAAVFKQDKKTVSRKLANIAPIGKKRGFPVYDVAEAAAWLVKPKIDIEKYMMSLRPMDLPPWLQRDFWDAMNKRQKWEEGAADLWRTDKIVEFLADVLRNIKNTVMLWNEGLEREETLSDEQRAYYRQMTDGLLDDLYNALLKMSDDTEFPQYESMIAEQPRASEYKGQTASDRIADKQGNSSGDEDEGDEDFLG